MGELTIKLWFKLSLLLFVVFVSSCAKDRSMDSEERESFTVGFKFKQFGSSVTPLPTNELVPVGAGSKPTAPPVVMRSGASTEQGYLYYWSFNAESKQPDVFLSISSSISYLPSTVSENYVAGWQSGPEGKGRAFSVEGPSEIVIKMPLAGASAVTSFALDVGSSDTGPKAFGIAYSQNSTNYTVLSAVNQFKNAKTTAARNPFEFTLPSLDLSKDLYIKITLLAGDRDLSGKPYNAKSGTFRMDNIRLLGLGEARSAQVQKLHYHIFDASTNALVVKGAESIQSGSLDNFSLDLPAGTYKASFVANVSTADLDVVEQGGATGYYISNRFANSSAQVFGATHNFSVAKDEQLELILNRYYSQVKFVFTNTEDLSHIEKMVIKRVHQPNFYAPFNTSLTSQITDVSEIVIYPDFDTGAKEITFNQFMGQVPSAITLSYEVTAFDSEDKVIGSFTASATAASNVQLTFRGKIPNTGSPGGGTGGSSSGATFAIQRNETWGQGKDASF